MNGAEAFVATLKSWGVDTFFGLPGSTEASLLEALRADGEIRYVLSLHEGVAVAMADGYARASGGPAVVGLHTTVGAMNGMGQLFNSSRDGIPVVMTVGHKDRVVLSEDGFCAFPDLPSLLRSFTKGAWQTLSAEMVAADLSRALLSATATPRGPAFLAVPEDLLLTQLSSPVDPSSLPSIRQQLSAGGPSPDELAPLAELIRGARKPLLILGSEASPASRVAAELAAEMGLGVVASELTDLVSFSFPSSDPHFLGVYGDDPAIIRDCDLILAVGGRVFFPFSDRLRPRLPAGAALAHIHPNPLQVGRRLPTDVGVVGDPQAVLTSLLAECRRLPDPGPREDRERAVSQMRANREAAISEEVAAAKGAQPLAVAEVVYEISRVLPPGTILVDEAVRGSRSLFRHGGVPDGGEIWRSSGGALGWGLPAAIGAKLARPDRPVVLVTGDGSLHFSVQALWTAVAQGAPVVVVVLDNGGYLAVKRAIENMLAVPQDPRLHPGTALPGIDHLAAARAYGAGGTVAHTAQEAAAAVEQALADHRIEVVSVPVAEIRP